MKALTVCQPYASLIAEGIKRVENRAWNKYRGSGGFKYNVHAMPLAIHAGKSEAYGLWDKRLKRAPLGGIVAVVDLVAIVRPEQALQLLPDQAEFIEGPWCWILKNPQPLWLEWRGQQGLWDVPDEALYVTASYEDAPWDPDGMLGRLHGIEEKRRAKEARAAGKAAKAGKSQQQPSVFDQGPNLFGGLL